MSVENTTHTCWRPAAAHCCTATVAQQALPEQGSGGGRQHVWCSCPAETHKRVKPAVAAGQQCRHPSGQDMGAGGLGVHSAGQHNWPHSYQPGPAALPGPWGAHCDGVLRCVRCKHVSPFSLCHESTAPHIHQVALPLCWFDTQQSLGGAAGLMRAEMQCNPISCSASARS